MTHEDASPSKKEEEKKEEEKKEEEKIPEEEPTQQVLKNPSRVVKDQEKKIQFIADNKYQPVLDKRFSGFVVLR